MELRLSRAKCVPASISLRLVSIFACSERSMGVDDAMALLCKDPAGTKRRRDPTPWSRRLPYMRPHSMV